MFLQTAGSCTELFSYVCKSVRIQRCLKLYHLSLLLVDVSHFPEIPLLLLFFSPYFAGGRIRPASDKWLCFLAFGGCYCFLFFKLSCIPSMLLSLFVG